MDEQIVKDDAAPTAVAQVGVDSSSKRLTGERMPHHAVCVYQADYYPVQLNKLAFIFFLIFVF